MVTMLELNLVKRLKGLFQALHVFFTHSPKTFLEFYKLVNLINTKGNKLFENVKTHWIISIFSLTKCVYAKYNPLIVKMHVKSSKNKVVLINMHALIKITQNQDIFVCDFVKSIKLA
jgi:hypothetical protein